MIRQLRVWKTQNTAPTLKIAAKAALKVLEDYYSKAMTTLYSSVSTVCDPRYKLKLFEHMFYIEGGLDSPSFRKAKDHFQKVYRDYKFRARKVEEYQRQEAETEAIQDDDSDDSEQAGIEDQ